MAWNHPKIVDLNKPYIPWIRLITIILVTIPLIVIGFSIYIADSSIRGSLVISDRENLWFSLFFFLVLSISVPISNYFGLKYGDKTVFFIGSVLFFVGIPLAGTTSNYWVTMFYRSVYAVGSGAIFPTTLTIISRSFGDKKTLATNIYIAVCFGLGTPIATLIGGYFAEFISWQSIFFISAIPAPIVLVFTFIFFDNSKDKNVKDIDFLEILFFLILIGCLITGLSNVKESWTTEGFRSNMFILCCIFFVLSTIGFIIRDLKAGFPLINIKLFKISSFWQGNLSVFIIGTIFYGTVSYLTQIFEFDLEYSKFYTGLKLISYGIVIGIAGGLSGLFAYKTGINIPILVGFVCIIISCFLQHKITIQSPQSEFLQVLIVRGIGIGLTLGTFTGSVVANVPKQNVGQGAVNVTLFRQLGGAIGAAILELIYKLRYPFHLLRFGEQMNLYSGQLSDYIFDKNNLLTMQSGSPPPLEGYGALNVHNFANNTDVIKEYQLVNEGSTHLTEAQLFEYASKQANILSINDAFFIMGIVGIILTIMIARGMIKKNKHNKMA